MALAQPAAAVAAPAPVARIAPSTVPAPEASGDENSSFALLGAALSAAGKAGPSVDGRRHDGGLGPGESAGRPVGTGDAGDNRYRLIEDACGEPLGRLIEELTLCRRYYEATFPSRPVDRLIFIGGEARQRSLCQQIAREMSLPAQVGDPAARLGKTTEIPPESGFDRRQQQPNWAVAIGLSAGPPAAIAGAPVTAAA
jgi:hypothetical protein